MAKIRIIEPNGAKHEVEGDNGSGDEAAIKHWCGIETECGGALACATCHVYVDDAWTDVVGAPSAMEKDVLDFAYEVKPTSRLSCQIKVSDEIDGLVCMRVPKASGLSLTASFPASLLHTGFKP
ncbi:MAG: 2Fe-2S iron-sulfur cluster-binding protein [Tepidamorphaceae bacterium]